MKKINYIFGLLLLFIGAMLILSNFGVIEIVWENLWPLFLSLRRIPLIVLRGEYSNVLTVKTLNKMMMKNSFMSKQRILKTLIC